MYHSPFHMSFHPTIMHKVYVAVLNPAHAAKDQSDKTARSSLAIIDLKKMQIIKEIRYISMSLTDDHKYLLMAVGGFQRYESGTVIVDVETDEIVGFLPGSQGSHDIAPVYTSVDKLKNSRSVAL